MNPNVLVTHLRPRLGEVEAGVDRLARLGQERLEQDGNAAKLFHQVIQDMLRRHLVGLDQFPRLLLVGVLVGRIEDLQPDPLERLIILARLNVSLDLLNRGFCVGLRVDDPRLQTGSLVQVAVVVLCYQADHPAVEITKIIRQVSVVDFFKTLPRKITISGERAFPEKIIAKCFTVRMADASHLIHDISESLGNLLALNVNETMAKRHSRQRQAGGHEHCRPQGAVEAGDVLADKVTVGRPPSGEQGFITPIADGSDVIEQSVEPDVKCKTFVERYADSPLLARPGDVNVLQTTLDQAENLVPAALRLDEVRVLVVKL